MEGDEGGFGSGVGGEVGGAEVGEDGGDGNEVAAGGEREESGEKEGG